MSARQEIENFSVDAFGLNEVNELLKVKQPWIQVGPKFRASHPRTIPQPVVHLTQEGDTFSSLVCLEIYNVTVEYTEQGYAFITIRQREDSKA